MLDLLQCLSDLGRTPLTTAYSSCVDHCQAVTSKVLAAQWNSQHFLAIMNDQAPAASGD